MTLAKAVTRQAIRYLHTGKTTVSLMRVNPHPAPGKRPYRVSGCAEPTDVCPSGLSDLHGHQTFRLPVLTVFGRIGTRNMAREL